MQKTIASREMDIAKLQKINEELGSKLQRAMKTQTLAKTKALQTKSSMEWDIEVR